jgi:site-specific DNA recombinase
VTRKLSAVPNAEHDRAVVYVRVSAIAGRDAEQFHSPDLQHKAVADLLGKRGLREVAHIEDIDKTGRDFNRDGIRRVLEMARAREFDVCALYDLSRLGRNTGESLRVIGELRELGVSVISTVEQIDDSPEGQFMLGQFLGMAQLYSDQMGRRWRQVHAHMASEGRQVGQAPIGYYQVDTGRTTALGRGVRSGPMLVDPVLGPVVTQAFADYAAGVRVRDICERIGAMRGKAIWPAQVRAMMRNPFYRGLIRRGDVTAPGVHEPLVDDATWAACQRRVAADAKTPSRRLEVAHALSGIAVCDACGARATLRSSHSHEAGRVRRLGCPRQADLRTCGGCGSMRVEEIEAAVLAWLAAYVARLRVDDVEQAGRRARAARAKSDAARLRGELKRTRAARSRLAVDRARRDIPAEVYADADAELVEAEERLVTAIAESESMEGLPPRRAAAAAAEIVAVWPDATTGERNRMLRQVIGSVRLRSGVGWREPVAGRVEVVEL